MEQIAEIQPEIQMRQQNKSNQLNNKKEDKKIQTENMKLKKRIYELEQELDGLKKFIGGI